MTPAGEEGGRKVVYFDWTAEYELTPFGQLAAPNAKLQETGYSELVLYDDGWRVRP